MGLFLRPRYRRTSGKSNDTTWSLTSGGPSKRRQRARLLEQATKPLDLSRGAVAYAENLLACVQRTTAPYSLEPHNTRGNIYNDHPSHITHRPTTNYPAPAWRPRVGYKKDDNFSQAYLRPRKSDETYNL